MSVRKVDTEPQEGQGLEDRTLLAQYREEVEELREENEELKMLVEEYESAMGAVAERWKQEKKHEVEKASREVVQKLRMELLREKVRCAGLQVLEWRR